jgi:hypothetical protein
METNNRSHVFGYNNSTIINRNKNRVFFCVLLDNAKFKNESLNPKVASEMFLMVKHIFTQEKLDECLNLYGNYIKARLYINNSYLETGLELVVNEKINVTIGLEGESRVVFKRPTNSDNESIDYHIIALDKSTAILETKNCDVRAYQKSTIIKRCKENIVNLDIGTNAKLIEED